jgi:hypothetical protein
LLKQSCRVESYDGSDRDTRKRKRGPEPDGLDARSTTSLSVPRGGDRALDDRDNQRGDEDQVRKRDGSLFGVLTEDDDEGDHHEPPDEIVWPHGPLLDYEVRNGKPVVLVPWHPTWEPPDEYSKEEVDNTSHGRSAEDGEGRS